MSSFFKHALMAAKAAAAAPPTYRFLRITVFNGNDAGYMACTELRWMVGATDYPTVAMTSNTTPSPLVALADSEYSSVYSAHKAFDANAVTYANPAIGPTPTWLQIDLGAGNGINPTGIAITPYSSYSPRTFNCEGSNTGAFAGEQTLLYSVTDLTSGWSGVRRNFTF